ncbi:D-hydantoinase/dihydropyrimidinase [Stieleria neptunia]|uniref:D-hydantoinase/dihydropyrimidinase n=1 Tax=Stieleria neptunia TaxID=2527979 RepID=A0A518I1W3_9BACT|nr:amidohydrolase family protein [Stieleria neptunia]QDV47099.1 D-hydantoinase/dihydropyrimidinase [Stieleria neptunia]
MLRQSNCLLGCFLFLIAISTAVAQDHGDARPVVGLRENPPDRVFLKDARVVVQPGQVLESASVSIQGTTIVAVGTGLTPPDGAHVIDCTGKSIYAGLIDGYGEVDTPEPPTGGTGHWNGNVLPRRAAATAIQSVSDVAASRTQGVTMRLIAPRGAIVKGSSCLVLLDGNSRVSLVDDDVAQHLQLTVPRDKRRDSYPNSPMGAIALLRQTLADADWYTRAWQAYTAKPELPRPTRNDDLARLADDRTDGLFVIDAPNERMALRAEQIAGEFSLDLLIRGSGREYRDLNAIADTGRPLLIPVDFPDAPDVSSEAAADDVTTLELMHWHFAPENPALLASAGVTFCLTSDGLDDPKSFLKNIRAAVERGLSADTALAAVTTTPARLFGVDEIAGRVRAGSLANLIVTEGDLFDKEGKVLETWVAGKRFEHDAASSPQPDALEGTWKTKVRVDGKRIPVRLELKREKKKWSGNVISENPPKTQPDKKKDDSDNKDSDQASARLNKVTRAVDRLTAWVDLSGADSRMPAGPTRITIVSVAEADALNVFSTLTMPDGTPQTLDWQRAEVAEKDSVESDADDQEGDEDEDSDDEKSDSEQADDSLLDEIAITYPLGGLGVTEPVPVAPAVLFRGATVWTCSDRGVLENTDVLVVAGKINAIGVSLKPPKDCVIVDASGKHLSPGLIDCHSHMGTDGGVNESGQAVTAEVRVGDFIDNSDINVYRQLAGGLTTSNILHGSANPIGGQNQVIKLRWGDGMQAMKFAEAPAGIKFALGENVKRSNRSESPTRYPASRMGVEQLFRDRFLAAKEYDEQHRRWRSGRRDGLPPRVDYELDVVAEILRGERWIHCHSYRQDEIVALLDLLDTFDVTIGTLQHILEGYKVADRMKQHGAMASAFSDWWAYKFEVYDAIPYNGAIMHDVGIVVSFNSDDRELARHLNTEAAKAVKYGGVPAEEALKFVTLNPAMQLRIDDHVGSIEIGKDADVVLWSGPPLSTLSRCEQTWVDGRRMFSLEQDRERHQRDARWRSLLIGKILDKGFGRSKGGDEEIEEEDRWFRYDEFCHGHDHDDEQDQHAGHNHGGVQR